MLSIKRNLWLSFALAMPAVVAIVLFASCSRGNRLASGADVSQSQRTGEADSAGANGQPQKQLWADEMSRRRYVTPLPLHATSAAAQPSRGNGIMMLSFRAVGLNRTVRDAAADGLVAGEVLAQIQNSPLFDRPSAFEGKLSEEEPPGTFTFTVAARLK